MYKGLVLVFVWLLSVNAYAMKATTVAGHVACLSEQWFDDMALFVNSDDKASFDAYIATQKCIVLKGGMPVTVKDIGGMFDSKSIFIFRGHQLWTYRKALRLE
nr:hypothetical protein 13 [Piscirickettsiaceae bacterium]